MGKNNKKPTKTVKRTTSPFDTDGRPIDSGIADAVPPGSAHFCPVLHIFEGVLGQKCAKPNQRVNLLIIDPFPPGQHDPQGIHAAILKEFTDEPFELPVDKRLTLASYQVEPLLTSYVEPIAVGDPLPDMPLFLEGDDGLNVPLEETSQTTWSVLPIEIRQLLEPPDRATTQ